MRLWHGMAIVFIPPVWKVSCLITINLNAISFVRLGPLYAVVVLFMADNRKGPWAVYSLMLILPYYRGAFTENVSYIIIFEPVIEAFVDIGLLERALSFSYTDQMLPGLRAIVSSQASYLSELQFRHLWRVNGCTSHRGVETIKWNHMCEFCKVPSAESGNTNVQ